VLGHGSATPRRNDEPGLPGLGIPPDLQRQLRDWIDVEAVGAAGFWSWLRTILPLLPGPEAAGAGPRSSREPEGNRVLELARDLVECARERAQLTVTAERYYRDNQALSRRVKALEIVLENAARAGRGVEVPDVDDARTVAERYLPRR